MDCKTVFSTPVLILQYQQTYTSGHITVCGFQENLMSKLRNFWIVGTQNTTETRKPPLYTLSGALGMAEIQMVYYKHRQTDRQTQLL